MNIIGIICEYNPFHNGHLYHINKIKEMYKNAIIILVMSGNVTERGDLSIINKWDKTAIALNYGIDLVVELPFVFSSQSADMFCYASIKILNYLGVNTIIFGSESNDINKLKILAKNQIDNKKYDTSIKELLKQGYNYPTALSKSLEKITNINIDTPNDILGIGYIREIIKNNYNMEPICIKRTNDYNSDNLDNSISSASAIRKAMLEKKDISNYIPNYVNKFINNPIYIENYYSYIKYKIISEINNLEIYHSTDKEIISRIKKYIYTSNTLNELILNIKTKNYTYNRLKRMFIHILFNFTKEEANNNKEVTYIRILGFNKKGQQYLNNIKKNIDIPLLTTYSDKHLYIENRVTNIININIPNSKKEYEYKIIIK